MRGPPVPEVPELQELAWAETALGELSLRRRVDPRLPGEPIWEVKLGLEYLMSSLFTAGERALARLGLARLRGEGPLEVVVGGLGLGYTAAAALDDERVGGLLVIEALGPVIEWHRRGLVPLGTRLAEDPRCRLVCGDFFALAADPGGGFDHEAPGRRFDAILLDIDHTPEARLSARSGAFYTPEGLARAGAHLRPGGVFGMWSDEPPEAGFLAALEAVFGEAEGRVVEFPNPLTGERSSCTVYLAGGAAGRRSSPSPGRAVAP